MKLVVLTGYPTSGKSTVSSFLAKELDFAVLGGDDLCRELFGHTYPFAKHEDPERMWTLLYRRRDALLGQGRDVVVDTTAYNNERRERLLASYSNPDKYVVWLQVHPQALDQRRQSRGWTARDVERWKHDVGWEDPSKNDHVLLVYGNNSPEDLVVIKDDLRKRLTSDKVKRKGLM